MKRAMVVGGHAVQMKEGGNWSKAVKQHCGIEVAYHYGSDTEFRGLPHSLPKDVGLVLIVVGSVNHLASNRAHNIAKSAGVRCETVSKDATRAVQHLQMRGYLAVHGAESMQAQTFRPTTKVETPEQAKEAWDRGHAVVWAQPVEQQSTPEVELASEYADWLDFTQVRDLLPDLEPSSFYKLAGKVIKRDEVRERRTRTDATGRKMTNNMLLWTMSEVEAVEALAKERGLLKPKVAPAPAPEPPKSNVIKGTPLRPLSEAPPLKFTQTFTKTPEPVVHAAPEPVVVISGPELTFKPVVSELRDYRAEMLTIMDEYAHKRTQDLQASFNKVVAERDALREQLAKIKAALGA